MIKDVQKFIDFLILSYPEIYNKVVKLDPEQPFRYSPNFSFPGLFNLFNPFKDEEEMIEYERIIHEYASTEM